MDTFTKYLLNIIPDTEEMWSPPANLPRDKVIHKVTVVETP